MSMNPSSPPDPPRPESFALPDCPAAADRRGSLTEWEPSFSKPPELAPSVAASAPEWPSQSSESSRVSDGGAGRRRSFLNSREDSEEIDALLDSGSDDDDINEDEDEDEACSLSIEFPSLIAAGNGYAVSNSRKRKIQDFYMESPLLKEKTELPGLSNGGYSGKLGGEFSREVGREFCEEVGGELGRQFGGEFGGQFGGGAGGEVGGDFSNECGVAQGVEFGRELGREFGGDFSDECGVAQEYESSSVVVDNEKTKKKKMMTTRKKSRGRKVRKTVNLMRSLIPGGGKLDSLSVFDEVIKYVKMLQQEVSLLEAAKKGKVSE